VWTSSADPAWISSADLRWTRPADLDLPHRALGVDQPCRATGGPDSPACDTVSGSRACKGWLPDPQAVPQCLPLGRTEQLAP
jgi:hypothetical protein